MIFDCRAMNVILLFSAYCFNARHLLHIKYVAFMRLNSRQKKPDRPFLICPMYMILYMTTTYTYQFCMAPPSSAGLHVAP